jgi:hypothetical protein
MQYSKLPILSPQELHAEAKRSNATRILSLSLSLSLRHNLLSQWHKVKSEHTTHWIYKKTLEDRMITLCVGKHFSAFSEQSSTTIRDRGVQKL